ncbi:hypothetical protein V8G69_15630 [Gaetbulibacter sp. M235]|uniref:hypothetical protein n=1 Tax=Gaetbulibacter sp. M235 TaxID=3126510 RepID=UPI00374E9578
MEDLDLNKYRLAWKNEKSFQAEKLSEIEIHNFMKSTSNIVGQYRRSLIFDMVFKSFLLISFIALIFLLNNQSIITFVNSFFVFIAVLGIIWQTKIYKRVEKISVTKEHLKDLLRAYIDFYTGQYIKSIFVSALSSTLFFLSGSLFYLHFKYEQIPIFELGDFIVLTIGIILSYGVSAFAQLKQNDYQIKQLESCLVEIEENTINASSIKKYKTNRIKNIVTIGITLIIGVIIFLYLIFGINNLKGIEMKSLKKLDSCTNSSFCNNRITEYRFYKARRCWDLEELCWLWRSFNCNSRYIFSCQTIFKKK